MSSPLMAAPTAMPAVAPVLRPSLLVSEGSELMVEVEDEEDMEEMVAVEEGEPEVSGPVSLGMLSPSTKMSLVVLVSLSALVSLSVLDSFSVLVSPGSANVSCTFDKSQHLMNTALSFANLPLGVSQPLEDGR